MHHQRVVITIPVCRQIGEQCDEMTHEEKGQEADGGAGIVPVNLPVIMLNPVVIINIGVVILQPFDLIKKTEIQVVIDENSRQIGILPFCIRFNNPFLIILAERSIGDYPKHDKDNEPWYEHCPRPGFEDG